MAHRLLKNNGFAPAWIQERRDLETDIRSFRLRRDAAGPESAGELCREAAALNRRIAAYNLKAPSSLLHLAPVDPESAC